MPLASQKMTNEFKACHVESDFYQVGAYPSSKVWSARTVGTIKSFNAKTGVGFVTSPEILEMFGKDLVLSKGQVEGRGQTMAAFPVGSQISLVVGTDNGKGYAYDIAPLQADTALDPGPRMTAGLGNGVAENVQGGHRAVVVPAFRTAATPSAAADTGSPRAVLPVAAPNTFQASPGDRWFRYTAPVKWYNAQKGFGFMDCQDFVSAIGKTDIFVHKSQIEHLHPKFAPGEMFSFLLEDDEKGQPMAVDLIHIPWSANESFAGQRWTAFVKSWHSEKKYGFLECEELASVLGKPDVFVHATQIPSLADFQPGQAYSFTLGTDSKGQPMAIDLCLGGDDIGGVPGVQAISPPITPAPQIPASSFTSVVGQRFAAPVKLYNPEKKFGFLDCEELASVLGKPDVFVHHTNIPDLEVFTPGQVYSFTLGLDFKGQPQAIDLSLGGIAADKAPDAVVGRRFSAPVKSFFPDKKFGFFVSEELGPILGKPDIFVLGSQIPSMEEFQPGQMYSFTLAVDYKGQPMAVDLEIDDDWDFAVSGLADEERAAAGDVSLQAEASWSSTPSSSSIRPPSGLPPAAAGRRFSAPVKSFFPEKKYGFLDCQEVGALLGKTDVFVHGTQIPNQADFVVGQAYTFTLGTDSKGKPMAIDLELGDDAASAPSPKRQRTTL